MSKGDGAALTTKELAAYLNISIGSAYALMRSRDFPAVCIRPGKGRGTYRVMRGALLDWLAAQGKGGVA
jgi:excisionase family DNA binding protein